jgi:hypothetical protein
MHFIFNWVYGLQFVVTDEPAIFVCHNLEYLYLMLYPYGKNQPIFPGTADKAESVSIYTSCHPFSNCMRRGEQFGKHHS